MKESRDRAEGQGPVGISNAREGHPKSLKPRGVIRSFERINPINNPARDSLEVEKILRFMDGFQREYIKTCL